MNLPRGRDGITAAVFFFLALALFAPVRTRYAYLWDSVEFVEALKNYDVTLSQPHAPGYFLYVMLGRAVNVVLGDPHASLVWLSVVAGAGLVAMMYRLGTAMFGRCVGVTAALLTMTSPLVWFFSGVALTYVVDALLVTVLVGWCWRTAQRGVTWFDAIGLGVMLAVVGGVRQQSLFGLLPLVIVTMARANDRRGAKVATGVLTCAAVCAGWVAIMLAMTGGWEAYRAALQQIAQFHAHKTLAGGGWEAVLWNVFFAGLYCCNGLLLGALAVPLAWGGDRRGIRVALLWILPMFLLAVAVGYTEAPGHVFTYLPGLILLSAAGMARLRGRVVVAAVVCGFNLFVFLAWPRAWDSWLWNTVPTARGLREHDQLIADTVQLVRSQYHPDETIICHGHGNLFFGLRHFQLYLPEFQNYRIDPDTAMVTPSGKPVLRAWRGQLEFVEAVPTTGWRTMVRVSPSGRSPPDPERWQAVPGSKGRFWEAAP